jgi:hypothetical protein
MRPDPRIVFTFLVVFGGTLFLVRPIPPRHSPPSAPP